MSIRPIDFQMLVPKAQKLSQDHQSQNYKGITDQQYLMAQQSKNAHDQSKKVRNCEQKDQARVKEEESKKKKSKKQTSKKSFKKKDVGEHIDIKI